MSSIHIGQRQTRRDCDGERIDVQGRIQARCAQPCIATGEPVPANVDEAFAYTDERGFYVPAADVEEKDGKFFYEGKPVGTPDAGTFWYHPHLGSAEQVGRGLYGALGWAPSGTTQECPWPPYPTEAEYAAP